MKKAGVLIIIGLLLINFLALTLVCAQEPPPMPYGINPEQADTLMSKIDYIMANWKQILLENSIVKTIDSFFIKISSVFQIIFAKPYSFSLNMLVTVILWVYFAIIASMIIGAFGVKKRLITLVLGGITAIILAQARLYAGILLLLTKINALKGESNITLIMIVIEVLVFAFVLVAVKSLTNSIKGKRKIKKEEREEEDIEETKKKVKELKQGEEKRSYGKRFMEVLEEELGKKSDIPEFKVPKFEKP